MSEVGTLFAAKVTFKDVAGFSRATFLVMYIAALLSPSGSVDALKSVVGKTSDESSILLILFAIRFTDALSKSITGERFGLNVEILNLEDHPGWFKILLEEEQTRYILILLVYNILILVT